MQECIGNVILNYKYYPGSDLYSDGDIEEEMLEIAKNYEEKDFDRIVAEKNSWAILYHFSHIRCNIINWLPITKRENILEIGSGCGAITGALSDLAKNVTCIELSKRRSMINAYRNQKRDNIEVLVGNFQEIEPNLNEEYDYITLNGVFEYGESYINSENPYVDWLTTMKKHLKPGGKIIIAIENRLGLKYWAGCTEDHSGIFYEGLEGYPDSKGARTFSKPELSKIIEAAGYSKYEYYYPYPDYKLPMVIYSDYYLPELGELNLNTRNFDRERLQSFEESRVYDTLIQSGLFPLYSNSFLVIIERNV